MDTNNKEGQASPLYKAKSAWAFCDKESEKGKTASFCDGYIDFLTSCKTERETIAFCKHFLEEKGFTADPGKDKYLATLRGKALFAFRKGTRPLSEGIRIIAAHADCPRLDFKPHPFIEQEGFAQAKTNYYGGLRKYQWLARPLALHGVICKDNGEVVPVQLGEEPGEPVFTIADLLPHLAQEQVAKTVKEAFQGEKLNVILGSKPSEKKDENGKDVPEPVKLAVLELLQQKYGVREEDFLSAEIEVVPAGPASYVGLDKSLIGGFGQDDRICAYTGLMALADSMPSAENCALILWDKEEIGSDGASGASSRFFAYCIEEVLHKHEPETSRGTVMMASQALSADVTAGMDPDYADTHDKTNSANLGYGPCFEKYTGAGGKYGASEAHAEYFASIRGLLNRHEIPWQSGILGRVDHGGGGTVALFLAAWGMNVIDFGPALLGMHSPFELSSAADVYTTYLAYKAFYEG